jgi:hypothetical protein
MLAVVAAVWVVPVWIVVVSLWIALVVLVGLTMAPLRRPARPPGGRRDPRIRLR